MDPRHKMLAAGSFTRGIGLNSLPAFKLIPDVPAAVPPAWIEGFIRRIVESRPSLPRDNALRCALLAYPGTWLLEAGEAADWWLEAIDAATAVVGRPQRPLG